MENNKQNATLFLLEYSKENDLPCDEESFIKMVIEYGKKLLNDDIQPFCVCSHGFKKKNVDKCEICGGKWKGRPKQNKI